MLQEKQCFPDRAEVVFCTAQRVLGTSPPLRAPRRSRAALLAASEWDCVRLLDSPLANLADLTRKPLAEPEVN